MPTPVSRTDTIASSPTTRASTSTDPPTGVNLTALVSRFTTTCLSLTSSAHTSPTPAEISSATVSRWRTARSRTQRQPLLEQRGQRERGRLELHPPGLDLREVEDL